MRAACASSPVPAGGSAASTRSCSPVKGAKVVVNDLGGSREGSGNDAGPAQQVVDEIAAFGGEAVANTDDISDWSGAEKLVRQAIDHFGGLDVIVNNAGILRDRMMFSMTEEEWDSVIKVHLKGTFAPSHHAAIYWRERAKEGETNDARIINTTSVSGIYGNAGQSNYGAAKAGIAAFTQHRRDGARPLRGHRQRDRTRRTHPDDRGPRDVRRVQGAVAPALRLAGGHLAGVTALGRHHRPDHRGFRSGGRGRGAVGPRPEGRPDRGSARRRRDHSSPDRGSRPGTTMAEAL